MCCGGEVGREVWVVNEGDSEEGDFRLHRSIAIEESVTVLLFSS